MRKYIASEVKGVFGRKTTYQYAAGLFVLCLLANFAMLAFRKIYGLNDGSYATDLISFAPQFFVIPYYSTIFIADIIFGKEYPNPHIKTKVTVGLSRLKLYFGKFISQIILGTFFMVSAMISFLGITYMFLAADKSIDLITIKDFCVSSLYAVPLWIAGVAIGNMFLFVFLKKRNAYLFYGLIVVLIPRLIIFLASDKIGIAVFVWIKKYILLTARFSELPYFYTRDLTKIIVFSIVYTVIASTIGLISFQKKEI